MAVNQGGIGKVGYPLVSDLDKSIARNYDVLLGTTSATVYTEDEELVTSVGGGVTLRGSFLIGRYGRRWCRSEKVCTCNLSFLFANLFFLTS